jgi:hypothetical protein
LFVAAPLNQAHTDTNASPPAVPADTTSSPTVQSPDTPTTNPSPAGDAPQDDIADIRPPLFFLHSWVWLWITLAALAAAALLVLLWKWFAPQRLLSAKSAYDLTLEKLDKARALLKEEEPMPYAILVSETVRAYLGQRFQTPSTRRTTEEFLRLMESDAGTPLAEHRDLLRHFLQACDLVKFAKYQPTLAELEQVQQRAVTFVTATKPAPPGAPKGNAQ